MNPAEYNRNIPNPGAYAKSWRILASLPPTKIVSVPGWIVGMQGWHDQTCAAGMALEHVRKALDSRINARAGYVPREPREGFYAHYRDSRSALDHNTRRVRVYQFETRKARARLSHLLARHDD